MTDSEQHPPHPSAPLDASYGYELCASCGYSLTGLTSSPTCPECGFDNKLALYSFFLDRRYISYVRSLRVAAFIIAGGAGLGIIGAPLFLFPIMGIAAGLIVQWAAIGIIALGVWLGTRPDPGLPRLVSAAPIRKLARGAAFATWALDLAFILSLSFSYKGSAFLAFVLYVLAFAIAVYASYDYLWWIARRARRPDARESKFSLAVLGVVLAVVRQIPFASVLTFATLLVSALFAARFLKGSLARMRQQTPT